MPGQRPWLGDQVFASPKGLVCRVRKSRALMCVGGWGVKSLRGILRGCAQEGRSAPYALVTCAMQAYALLYHTLHSAAQRIVESAGLLHCVCHCHVKHTCRRQACAQLGRKGCRRCRCTHAPPGFWLARGSSCRCVLPAPSQRGCSSGCCRGARPGLLLSVCACGTHAWPRLLTYTST